MLVTSITMVWSEKMVFCKIAILVLLMALAECVDSDERSCSKYDFEEKVLEKLVRMEVQTERMKSQMEQSVKDVENMMAWIGNTLKAFDTKLETYDEKQQEHSKNIDDKLVAIENKTVETLDEKIQELHTLKDDVVTPTVAFKARLDSDITVSIGHTIVFPTVLFNEGGDYNPGTGKFTTPVSGTYMFTIAFCLKNSKTLVAGIMVDDKKYTVTLLYGAAGHDCLTADTVAVLTAGQVVWVEVLSGGHTGNIIYQHDSFRWNTFSGVLIHR